jgi:hypothetical protein
MSAADVEGDQQQYDAAQDFAIFGVGDATKGGLQTLKDKINMADNQEQDESSHDSGEEDNKKKMPELDEIVEELD